MPAPRTVYLDHSASTPCDPRVVEAMTPYFSEVYGNSSSSHGFGRKAEMAIEKAREHIAAVLRCHPNEIIFTSGGSESDNLAIRGAGWLMRSHGKGNHLITTPVEHSAVSVTVKQMSGLQGFQSTFLPVGKDASIDPEDLANHLTDQTSVVSVIYANNEVGTLAPLAQLAAQAHARGAVFHTDAVQAAGQLLLDVTQLGVDLMSLSAHKFYGPKGVGALYVRDGIDLTPAQSGGSHERGRRAGTHNTPFIVGMAKALQIAEEERDARTAHYRALRDQLIDGILTHVPDAYLTGHPTDRLPSHASFVFAHVDSSKLLMHLDMRGIAGSGGSACKTGNPEPSGVLLAMGYPPELAIGSLRLTVGLHTTPEEITYTVEAVRHSVEKLRALAKLFSV
jgi:cysteine desulfurase